MISSAFFPEKKNKHILSPINFRLSGAVNTSVVGKKRLLVASENAINATKCDYTTEVLHPFTVTFVIAVYIQNCI